MQCVLWLLAGWLHGAASAQSSIMIWPLDPVIEDDQRASAMWLENRGNQTVTMQIRILAWSQSGSEESYDSQEVVLASPPLAVIPAGQRQLIRLMNTKVAPDGKELAYRVLVDEVPNADKAGGQDDAGQASSMGIKLQIRYSVPLFVSGKGHWTKQRPDRKRDPATAAQPELQWHMERDGADYYLAVRNSGAAHARLTAVQWVNGKEVKVINPGLLGYALPGVQMRWRLESPPPAGFTLQAKVNAGESPVQLSGR